MPVPCVVNADDVTTIPKVLLQDRITILSSPRMRQVAQAVMFALDLEE
jgi:mRNA-degrading endonuclease toxin of MazEF toxin-antitoxin module